VLRGEIKEEKEAVLRIDVDKRLDLQVLEARLRERGVNQVVVDLTDLCELSPAGLSRLLWVRGLTGVEFTLPRHPFGRSFLELLGFGETVMHSEVDTEQLAGKGK